MKRSVTIAATRYISGLRQKSADWVTMPSHSNKYAFTILEMSIVIAVVGLLVGLAISGSALIRASALRSAAADYEQYASALRGFRDRFSSAPGDMTNAELFWGKDATHCVTSGNFCSTYVSGADAPTGTCNGNGNGRADQASVYGGSAEIFQIWKQLQLSGLVNSGTKLLSGLTSCKYGTSYASGVLQENSPGSRISKAGWGAFYNPSGDSGTYSIAYGNMLSFGGQGINWIPSNPALTPREAWSFDSKVDDGKPGQGKVILRFWQLCSTSTSKTDLAGAYKMENDSDVWCAFYFPNAF